MPKNFIFHPIGADEYMNWAYLAGFFDGEGSVYFPKKRFGHVSPQLDIVNTNHQVMLSIKRYLDRKLTKTIRIERQARSGNHKDIWRIRITNHNDVLFICKKLIKYSIVKRDIISKAIDFIENREWNFHPPRKALTLDKNLLYHLYWEQKLSVPKIAKQFRVGETLIYRRMEKFGIPRRSFSELKRDRLGRFIS